MQDQFSKAPGFSVFRTNAWVQAWLDTWGKHPSIEIIDLGGRNQPLEMLYRTKSLLKGILPINTLCIAGNGFGSLSTPRSEYNSWQSIDTFPDLGVLANELKRLNWHQFHLPDISTSSNFYRSIMELATKAGWSRHIVKTESSYMIQAKNADQYKKQLSKSTRLKYFNRRVKLGSYGTVERFQIPVENADFFFEALNSFHVSRWGRPCYSNESIRFMVNFLQRLEDEGGSAHLDTLYVAGELASVLFDVQWEGMRYNFQSGYHQSKFPKISIGAIHLGYAIEDAILEGITYDCLAGTGKNSDYKRLIATHTAELQTLFLNRKLVRALRFVKNKMF